MTLELRPKGLRSVVVVGSIVSGGVGLITLGLDLILPTYAWVQDGASGESSLLAIGLEPRAATYILLVALICCALVLGGVGIRVRKSGLALVGAIISGSALVIASLSGGWFIGPTLFPAAIIGLAATVGGLTLGVMSVMSIRSRMSRSRSPD